MRKFIASSMADSGKTLIMKFGGTAVRTPESFGRIAELIIARQQEFSKIAIVVSAMGEMTDELIGLAHKVHPHPPRREYDMLVSAGERISISLLAMALERRGVKAVSFTGSQSGIITTSEHSEARIKEVRPERLIQSLISGKIVIVAGFQGVSQEREITTLGRGGSDTSAVALGVALKSDKVEFYKDVPGICRCCPEDLENAEVFSELTYAQALSIVKNSGGQVLHPRAIELAAANGLVLHVRSFKKGDHRGTWIQEKQEKKRSEIYEKFSCCGVGE